MGGKRVEVKPKQKMKQKMKNRTKFTLFSMFNLIWYTVVALWLTSNDHVVPDSLTMAWFAAWTVELALLFGIKVKSKGENEAEG